MKLCRFDEDRLGVVIGDTIHDITNIQTEIRNGARYDMREYKTLLPPLQA